MEDQSTNEPNGHLNGCGLIVLGLLVCFFNLLIFPIADNVAAGPQELLGIAMGGALGAELGLVAAWAAFSPAHFLARLAISGGIGLVLFGCWVTGFLAAIQPPSLEFIPLTLVNAPVIFIAALAPPMAARTWLRWEVAATPWASTGSYTRPTQLRDIILGTVVASVALTMMRQGTAAFSPNGDDVLMGVGIMMIVTSAASALTVLPLLFFVLGVERFSVAAILGGTWFLMTVSAQGAIIQILSGALTGGVAGGCVIFTGTFALLTTVGMAIYRAQGFRLRRQPRVGTTEAVGHLVPHPSEPNALAPEPETQLGS